MSAAIHYSSLFAIIRCFFWGGSGNALPLGSLVGCVFLKLATVTVLLWRSERCTFFPCTVVLACTVSAGQSRQGWQKKHLEIQDTLKLKHLVVLFSEFI